MTTGARKRESKKAVRNAQGKDCLLKTRARLEKKENKSGMCAEESIEGIYLSAFLCPKKECKRGRASAPNQNNQFIFFFRRQLALAGQRNGRFKSLRYWIEGRGGSWRGSSVAVGLSFRLQQTGLNFGRAGLLVDFATGGRSERYYRSRSYQKPS